MKTTLLVPVLAIMAVCSLRAETDEAYRKVIYDRSEGIVKTLDIESPALRTFYLDLIAKQYMDLGVINDNYAAKEKEIKAKGLSGDEQKAALQAALDEQRSALQAKHYYFVCQLEAALSREQVEKVKDGMTMNVLPRTYQAHLDMIPTLTEEEKLYIRAALMEAREYAMDCSDSKVKHAWFGKYKGRINNYLSRRGYDLKKEREAWNQRIAEAEAKEKAEKAQ